MITKSTRPLTNSQRLAIWRNALSKAINDVAHKSISEAIGGYSVQSAIAQVVTEEVAEGAIAESIKASVQRLDTDALVQSLADELSRAIVRGTVHILHEGVMETICKLRGLSEYSAEDKYERVRLQAELFGGREAS